MAAFREDKLASLIAYLTVQSEGDRWFGKVKLAKLLTFIDFAAYVRWGSPITNAQYVKLELGPVPRQLDPTLNLLKAKGQLELVPTVIEVKGKKYDQERPTPTSSTVWPAIVPSERALSDEMMRRYYDDTAMDVSDLSHQFPGWAVVKMRHTIPFHMAFIDLAGPTEQDYHDSQALAEQFGWT
jgi:hypothetical protein